MLDWLGFVPVSESLLSCLESEKEGAFHRAETGKAVDRVYSLKMRNEIKKVMDSFCRSLEEYEAIEIDFCMQEGLNFGQ